MRTTIRAALGEGQDRDFRLFILATILAAFGSCANATAFNNYLKDYFALDVAQRTFLEFPRETPGFLVSLFVGILAAIGETRIAGVAGLAAAAGMLALGWIPASFGLMVGSVFLFSSGQHILMPLQNSLGMSFAADGKEGSVLGKIQIAATAALLAGAALLLVLFKYAGLSYRAAFTSGSICYALAALALLAMRPRRERLSGKRFVVRKEYGRYYLLSILFGARKQLFITFGPWMLVDYFKQPVSIMTLLFFVVAVLGLFAKPAVGRLTDRLGARAVFSGEAILTIGLCLGYAFAPELLPRGAALVAIACFYVLDQASDAVSMTRAIYAKQIVRSPEELAPTLSLGISIDHVVSMFLPMLGGLAWRGGAGGYKIVFLGGAAIALLNLLVARGVGAKVARPAPAAAR
ncbi:MAG: hypothetical protein JNG85_14115 [Spirochaetaceae bacterium]|nr:hypothetical protein [Spirochaetaceae bacterium]